MATDHTTAISLKNCCRSGLTQTNFKVNLSLKKYNLIPPTVRYGRVHVKPSYSIAQLKSSDETSLTFQSLHRMINADYAVLVVLVSLGALIGKVNSLQLLIIALIETIFFAVNESICKKLLQISDFGQSMIVHLFGAVFGIAISRMIFDKRVCTSQALSTSNKSEMYAMIGRMHDNSWFIYKREFISNQTKDFMQPPKRVF